MNLRGFGVIARRVASDFSLPLPHPDPPMNTPLRGRRVSVVTYAGSVGLGFAGRMHMVGANMVGREIGRAHV